MTRTGYTRNPAQAVAAAACTVPVMIAVLLAFLTLGRLPAAMAPAAAALLVFDVAPPPPPPPPVTPQAKPSPTKVLGRGSGRPRASLRPVDPSPPVVPTPHVVDPGIARVPINVLGAGSGTGGAGPGTGGGDGGGAPESVAPPVRVALAHWARYPTKRELFAYYPDQARRARINGTALLVCHITLGELARDCIAFGERPRGYGFAAAAIASAHIFRIHPVKVDGVAIDGALVAIPVTFRN